MFGLFPVRDIGRLAYSNAYISETKQSRYILTFKKNKTVQNNLNLKMFDV